MGNAPSNNDKKNEEKDESTIKSRSIGDDDDDKPAATTTATKRTSKVTIQEDKEEEKPSKSPPSPPKRLGSWALSSGYVFNSSVVGEISIGENWTRRRQVLSMFSCSLYFLIPCMMYCWGFCLYAIICYDTNILGLPIPPLYSRTIMAIYLCYIFFWDKSPNTGSRNPWMRNLRTWWGHACDYLPLLLVKTADLPPDQRYVMGYHPHGIISIGAFCAFATDSAQTLDLTSTKHVDEKNCDDDTTDEKDQHQHHTTKRPRGFSSLFPNIDRRVLTLKQNFMTPLLREYTLWMGACDSSKESFRNILSKPSTAVVVVVGGAAESLIVEPGCMDLILEHRRGFVREAIMADAHLVPVLGFGESDLYHVYEVDSKSKLAWFQRTVKKYLGFGMPIFQGRSVFMRDRGIMAKRTPVCVVVGSPIPPPKLLSDNKKFHPLIDRKTDKPLNEDGKILIEWHSKYVKALQDLDNQYKNASWNMPGMKRQRSLRIIK